MDRDNWTYASPAFLRREAYNKQAVYEQPPYLLRRTKALIADQMPVKVDKIVFCPLAPEQVYGYRRLCEHSEMEKLLSMNDPCPCDSTDDEGRPFRRRNCCDDDYYKEALRVMNLMTCYSPRVILAHVAA